MLHTWKITVHILVLQRGGQTRSNVGNLAMEQRKKTVRVEHGAPKWSSSRSIVSFYDQIHQFLNEKKDHFAGLRCTSLRNYKDQNQVKWGVKTWDCSDRSLAWLQISGKVNKKLALGHWAEINTCQIKWPNYLSYGVTEAPGTTDHLKKVLFELF